MQPYGTRALAFGLGILAAHVGGGAAQVVPGAPGVDWERERQEYSLEVLRTYNTIMQEWREAWESGDPGEAAEFYAEAARLFVPDGETIQGREAIQSYLAATLPGVVEMRTGLTDFVASERLAYALGPFYFRLQDATAGERTMTGTYVAVLVREGRRWLIRSQVFRLSTSEGAASPSS